MQDGLRRVGLDGLAEDFKGPVAVAGLEKGLG